MNSIAFETLFKNATIGIITVDEKGTILIANPYSLIQFGYTDERELVGQKVEMLIPQRFGSHVHKRESFTSHPKSRPMGVGMDLYAKRKDGSEFAVEISLSHYHTNGKGFVIAFIIDVTTRKEQEANIREQQQEKERMAEELQKLNEHLEQKVEDRTMMLRETLHQLEKSRDELTMALEKEKELNDLKSRFVSMASHEFRTPLSTILSSASLIEKYKLSEEQEKRDKHINRIKSQVRNLSSILEEFLSLGRLEEGRVFEKREDFNIRQMLSELMADLNNLTKSGQTIALECAQDLEVFLDKQLLKNVLTNLISNAIKYSGEQTVVRLIVHKEKGILHILIKDEGIGISEEDLKHLTDRFFRGTNAINIQGTGLGLHIVKKYLEVMDGNIRFKSQLNRGTEVSLVFNQ